MKVVILAKYEIECSSRKEVYAEVAELLSNMDNGYDIPNVAVLRPSVGDRLWAEAEAEDTRV